MASVDSSFLKDLKLIRKELVPVWNSLLERFQILWKNPKTGKVKIIMTVEGPDGEFRPCDRRTILWLSHNVAWDLLDKYPEPQDMYHYLKSKKLEKKNKEALNRRDYVRWWNKDHRTWWKKAFENAQRGIFSLPETREKKIIVHA